MMHWTLILTLVLAVATTGLCVTQIVLEAPTMSLVAQQQLLAADPNFVDQTSVNNIVLPDADTGALRKAALGVSIVFGVSLISAIVVDVVGVN